jgi:hypothetical protein
MRSLAVSPEIDLSPPTLSDDILRTDIISTVLAGHFMRPIADTTKYLADPFFREELHVALRPGVVKVVTVEDGVEQVTEMECMIMVIDGIHNLHVECPIQHEEGTPTCDLTIPIAHASGDSWDPSVVRLPVEDEYFARIVEQAA